MRILVTGSRDWPDGGILKKIYSVVRYTTIVDGVMEHRTEITKERADQLLSEGFIWGDDHLEWRYATDWERYE